MSKPYSLHKLSNGLRVVLAPNQATKAVTVMVAYKVGSRDEPAPLNGAAHFIEHLMFKGSKKYPTARDVSKTLDSLGAEYNAFTGKDMTAYYVKVAADKLATALDVLSDMLIQPKFLASEIERERGVIIEEINMYQDNPRAIAAELAESLIYQGHPLARDIIGTKRIISSVTRQKLIEFKNKYYTSDRAVVSVAGKFSQAQVLDMGEKLFKSHRSHGRVLNKKLFKDKQQGERVKLKSKKTEQVSLVLGLPALSDEDVRLPTLKILTSILGGSMSSRLFIGLRERRGLCYFIRAETGTYEETGEFIISAGLDQKRIKQALTLIMQELRKIKTQPVTANELRRAKDLIRGRTILGLEQSEALANFYAKEVLYREKIVTPEQKLRDLRQVKPQHIKQLAQELFKSAKLSLAIVSPLGKSHEAEFRRLLKI